MAENVILEKTRQAIINLLTAGLPAGTTIYNERNSAEKVAPDVAVGASNAQEEPLSTGNYWVDAEVSVRVIAAVDAGGTDPKPAGDNLSALTFELLEVDDLEAQLTAALEEFTVIGLGAEKSFEESVDGDSWVQTWKRRMYCAGSDL